jgi:hypothetical protein
MIAGRFDQRGKGEFDPHNSALNNFERQNLSIVDPESERHGIALVRTRDIGFNRLVPWRNSE